MAKKAKQPDNRTEAQKTQDKEKARAERAAKFKNLGAKRMNAAITKILLLGNLSNRSSYEYETAQLAAMEKALYGACDSVFAKFKAALEGKKDSGSQFTF